jgi:hypothetical protein
MAFRYGKLARMVDQRLGSAAVEVFMKMATLGHTRISDVVEAFGLTQTTTNGAENHTKQSSSEPLVNGTSTESEKPSKPELTVKSLAHVHYVVYQLLKSGFLSVVSEHDYRSWTEIEEEATTLINSSYSQSKPKGKDKVQAEQRIDQLKREWRDEAFNEVDDSDRPLKRRKLDGPLSNGVKPGDQLYDRNYDDLDDYDTDSKFRLSVRISKQYLHANCLTFNRTTSS